MIGSQQLVFNITWVSQCEFFCLSPLGRYKEYVLFITVLFHLIKFSLYSYNVNAWLA